MPAYSARRIGPVTVPPLNSVAATRSETIQPPAKLIRQIATCVQSEVRLPPHRNRLGSGVISLHMAEHESQLTKVYFPYRFWYRTWTVRTKQVPTTDRPRRLAKG